MNKMPILQKNDDILFDYCHCPYEPNASYKGKLKSENLLFNSIEPSPNADSLDEIIKLLKSEIGADNTIWGIKKIGKHICWEFYFYNYEKKDKLLTISNILNVTRKLLSCDISINENIAYFMFSLDISDKTFHQNKIEGVHLYFHHLSVTGGYCYYLTNQDTRMENIYRTFYNPKAEFKEILNEINNSMFNDLSQKIPQNILIKELTPCKHICISHKEDRDGIYYSGIDIGQFLFFLNRFDYPSAIVSYVSKNKDKLNHLLFDIGFDYLIQNKKFLIVKSGYYGSV